MIKILICDDQDIIREGLKLILDSSDEFNVVATAEDGARAIELIPDTQPDIILMDLNMPIMNGVTATENIKRDYPEIKILVLTTYQDDEWFFDAIRSGADSFLLKDAPHEKLFTAIHDTINGKTHVDPSMAGKLFNHVSQRLPSPDSQFVESLTDREREILTLLARGFTNPEIASSIHLSEGTVRNYVSSIFVKLDVSDRTQAALLALRYGLLDIGDL